MLAYEWKTAYVWGKMNLGTLFKNEQCWGDIHAVSEKSVMQHCRRIPTFIPPDTVAVTKIISVKHYGYDKVEMAKQKQAWYQENDTDKSLAHIGTTNYQHLTDETLLSLVPYTNPTLSVVMLMHNELFDVMRQLRNWAPYAEEVLLVDTGSTDGGDALAESFGIRVEHYTCCEKAKDPDHLICDFSAARNYAISKATGDYILFLDPDETLGPQAPVLLPRYLLQNKDVYIFPVRNWKKEDGKATSVTTAQGRLFRRDPRIQYDGRLHETIEPAMKDHPELEIIEIPLDLHHWGFINITGEERAVKNRRYGARLLDILEKDPNDWRALFALGNHLIHERQFDDGDKFVAQSLAMCPEFFTARYTLALRLVRRGAELLIGTPAGSVDPKSDAAKRSGTLLEALKPWCGNIPVPQNSVWRTI